VVKSREGIRAERYRRAPYEFRPEELKERGSAVIAVLLFKDKIGRKDACHIEHIDTTVLVIEVRG